MTTRKFSAVALPHPRYSFKIGSFDLRKTLNPTWLPRFSRRFQLIEVRTGGEYGHTPVLPSFCDYIVLENARLELFIRRDFISQFVNKGTIYLEAATPYQIHTSGGTLTILMNEKQYRQFGLVAKRVIGDKASGIKSYRIDIDLKDEKLKKSNKYQDRLVMTLRRLEPISKLYFRFVPNDATKMTNMKTTNSNGKCMEFFQYVMDEYAIDGFQPVPLTGCFAFNQRLERQWTNYAQQHPSLNVLARLGSFEGEGGIQRNVEILEEVVDIINWLGYQMLSLDCDRQEIQSSYSSGNDNDERVDVTCALITGLIDHRQIQDNLDSIFLDDDSTSINKSGRVLRALVLQAGADDSGAVLLQHCSAPNLITVADMSSTNSR